MTPLSPPSHQRLLLAAASTALAAALLPISPVSPFLPVARSQDFYEDRDELLEVASQAQEIASSLEIQSNSTAFDETLGIVKAMGDVEIRYGNVIIQCQQAEFHQSSGKVFARDDVTIYKDGGIFNGEEVIYDTKTGEMTSTNLRSALEPLYYQSAELNVPTESTDMIEMGESFFTTHDSANPNFRVTAKRMRVFPGDKVTMKGVKIYAGNTPIFWLPYLAQPLDDELGYYFLPGFSSPWGAFLLNQYGFMIGDHTLAQAHLDYRSERGIAGGVEFKSERYRGQENFGRLNLYFAADDKPEQAYSGRTRTVSIPPSDRYRINLQHRVYLPGPEKSTLYVDIDINKLSDRFFYEDFFPSEYRRDPEPDNIVNLVKTAPWGTISLLTRMEMNDFFQRDERLPELAIDAIRTPLGETGAFYNGYTTAGVLRESLAEDTSRSMIERRSLSRGYLNDLDAGVLTLRGGDLYDADGNLLEEDFDPNNRESLLTDMDRLLEPRGYTRFDTYHEILYPGQIGGFLNVVPRIGGGYTNYSDIQNPGIGSFDRTIAHAGLETSFKFSKRLPDVYNRGLGLDGLMHSVQPFANYSLVATDEIGGRFTPIDRLTPTTRLRPIDLPMFTAVDGIRDWQIARIGVSNRLITRRNAGSHNWLTLNTYFDNYIDDPEFDRDFSNLFNDLTWSPVPWFAYRLGSQVPAFEGGDMAFTELENSLNFMPTDWFNFSLGYYHLSDHPFFRDSELFTVGTYARLSDQWGVSTVHRFDADDGTLEIQQYQIHRDLSSWTASLGAIVRDNRSGDDEFGILLSLTLKAFPKVTLPLDFEAAPGN